MNNNQKKGAPFDTPFYLYDFNVKLQENLLNNLTNNIIFNGLAFNFFLNFTAGELK